MKEIKCPNCGDSFKIDESGYAQILQQVRNNEFERELNIRKAELEQVKIAELNERMYAEQKKHDEIMLIKLDLDYWATGKKISKKETNSKNSISVTLSKHRKD